MTFSNLSNAIFNEAIKSYHETDHVDAVNPNPYTFNTIECDLFLKSWIDTVQWHLEDIIRKPNINPLDALAIKRRIDKSNQDRTDLVERIDCFFWEKFKNVKALPDAVLNTESPAWAIDRLSILVLKIWHMRFEAERKDATLEHRSQCQQKLNILLEQREDLSLAIDQLLSDIEIGHRYMKVYKQMKMYNDPSLNPSLYTNSTK
jgi:hypothetical protein